MKITRAEVLKALKTEPVLEQGSWVAVDGLPEVGKCSVCAVGAVLRQAGLTNDLVDDLPGHLSDYSFLTHLSDTFERAATPEEGRFLAIEYALNKCPKSITIPDKLIEKVRKGSLWLLIANLQGNGFMPESISEKRAEALQKGKKPTEVEAKALKRAARKLYADDIRVAKEDAMKLKKQAKIDKKKLAENMAQRKRKLYES